MTKKTKLILVLFFFFLLIGGGGVYLLYRVNQADTVSPTDSDAAQDPECLQRTLTISFSSLETEEGKLEVVTNLGKAKIDTEGNQITQVFTSSCDKIDTIKAVPKEGYTFLHWDDSARKRTHSSSEITIPFKDVSDKDNTTLKAVYAKDSDVPKTYTVSYSAFCSDSDEDTSSLLLCSVNGSREKSLECLSQNVPEGKDGSPVYVNNGKCVFSHWETEEGNDLGSTVPHIAKAVSEDMKIKAIFEIFEKIDKEEEVQTYKLKFLVTPVGSGSVLDSNNKNITNQTITIPSSSADFSFSASANSGYKFVEWSDGNKDNPRSVKLSSNLTLTAKFEKEVVVVPETPPEVSPPSGGTSQPGGSSAQAESMPQTSSLPDRSLYIITVGALILSLGMIFQLRR